MLFMKLLRTEDALAGRFVEAAGPTPLFLFFFFFF
jgi:hypothetical protein